MSEAIKVPIPEGVDPEQFRELVERLLNQRLAEAYEKELQRLESQFLYRPPSNEVPKGLLS